MRFKPRSKAKTASISAIFRAPLSNPKTSPALPQSDALSKPRVEDALAIFLYFYYYRNMRKPDPLLVTRTADRFSALGSEPRLQIMRSLLASHPTGLNVGEVQDELEIPASTLSHHLEKLKQVGLVNVRRDGTFLWYSANTDALREVLGFLYEECCTRSRAVSPEEIVQISR
jgi:DNA-binding transcriptional ArsR family regulator